MKGTTRDAIRFAVKGAPMVVITDPDGQEIHRASIASGEPALEAAWTAALEKYKAKPVSWGEDIPTPASGKLLVLGFTDGEDEESLEALKHPMIAKYHDRISFVRVPFEKNGATAKTWRVYRAPTLVLADGSAEDPSSAVLSRLAGDKSPASIRVAILKAFLKLKIEPSVAGQ